MYLSDILEWTRLTGLSQSQFCKEYHIALGTLKRWEQGQTQTPEHYLWALNELIEYQRLGTRKELMELIQ